MAKDKDMKSQKEDDSISKGNTGLFGAPTIKVVSSTPAALSPHKDPLDEFNKSAKPWNC